MMKYFSHACDRKKNMLKSAREVLEWEMHGAPIVPTECSSNLCSHLATLKSLPLSPGNPYLLYVYIYIYIAL